MNNDLKLSRTRINELLLILEHAHNALTHHHNFGLAVAHIGEYYERIPLFAQDIHCSRSLFEAISERNAEHLLCALEAEIERLRTQKIRLLHLKITRSGMFRKR